MASEADMGRLAQQYRSELQETRGVLRQHELYEPKDFTEEEYQRRNQLAVMVIDGGLGICKRCGAGEAELETFVTCEAYRADLKRRHAASLEGDDPDADNRRL